MAQERTTRPAQDQSSSQSQELIMQRIRESINWLRRTPTPTSAPSQQSERNVRDAIRQLSRQRVSDLLRQLRAAHGLSYEQVHDRTGLSQQLLFDVEFKDRRLALDELRRLASCYQVTVDDLLGIDIDV
ncbi:MAG: helix-turn-helix transcriptional regulator [Caldilineaceae bacterium]|nr:helix-turn-helix transcriptional regulator [Caldilineaceae bacterium]